MITENSLQEAGCAPFGQSADNRFDCSTTPCRPAQNLG